VKNLFAKSVKPFIDPTRGDAQAAELRKAVAAGSWQTVEAAYNATDDPTRREFLVDAVVQKSTDLKWVDAWVRARPDSSAARVMWGAAATEYAFFVRTGAEPQHVAADRWKTFHEWLTHAEEQLQTAATLDPDDSGPWVRLVWTAVGLGIPYQAAADRWANLNRRNPRSDLGTLAYCTYISPRWAGSHDLMWQFVHELLASEPEGSPRWQLVPNAHIEQWVANRMDPTSTIHSSRYFQQPQVQQEIKEAYARYLGSPRRMPSALESQFRATFACTFYLMGERDALRHEMEQLGPGIQNVPWAYLGGSVLSFERVKEAAGLK
jgi:Domain of unknown function (DUF4034)